LSGGRVLEFALLGHPVSHSLSPAIHRAAFEALGVEARYRAVDVTAEELEAAMRRMGRCGGGNVTLPHKRRAAALLDGASTRVRVTGACNCFWFEGERGLVGDNTDVAGFLQAARDLVGKDWPVGRVLLLGAGGAAAAVMAACLEAGVGSVDVLNRTAEHGRSMASRVGGPGATVRVLEGPQSAGEPRGPGATPVALALPEAGPADCYDLVVNATRLGLEASDPLPLALEGVGGAAILDLVYAPNETRWVHEARARDLRAADGLGMLVEQAAASLACWLGVEPPRRIMLEAAAHAAGRAT